jgi:hypothetical protein
MAEQVKTTHPLYDLFALYCNVYTEKKKIYMCVGFLCWTCNQTPSSDVISLAALVYTIYSILHLVISENDNVTTTHHDRGS